MPGTIDPFKFLGHDGEMAALVRKFEWRQTPLGDVSTWPQSLKTAIALLIQSPVPIVMLWGEEGVMIYNDAYSVFAGARHPALFGSNVREGWAEIADFNDHVMKVGLSGKTLAYRDQELTLHRKGYPEQVWMDLDYSPVMDEEGRPAGVIAIVVETTERVLAERRNKEEFQRLQNLFSQAPTFMAMLSGQDHRFDLINPEYQKLIGSRDVLGHPIASALPEMADQGFISLLDQVFATGEPVIRMSERVVIGRAKGGRMEERFVDFVFQPIRDEANSVSHIFVQGSDVTDRVRAENYQKLLINELNHRVKNTLASIQSIVSQTLRNVEGAAAASNAITRRILALSKAHNVLTNENWSGASLKMMIESALEAFQEGGKRRFVLSGPDLRVGPHAAMSVALAIHELATNALKYGALSVPDGYVDIAWSLEDQTFRLLWRERGGPAVIDAGQRGFGSRLILQVLPHELSGDAQLRFDPAGVIFTLDTTLEAIRDKPVMDSV
jgi:PAS domain S-box-containing protein